jgi:predicted DNA-binding transcriptional regulator AlpA
MSGPARSESESAMAIETLTERKFCDVKQLCDQLGVTPKTLRKWVRLKQFPAPIRLGSPKCPRLRWPREIVAALLAGRQEGSHQAEAGGQN